LIVADANYIGDMSVLVPWLEIQILRLYDEFNFKHSSIGMAVEHSFGNLKGM